MSPEQKGSECVGVEAAQPGRPATHREAIAGCRPEQVTGHHSRGAGERCRQRKQQGQGTEEGDVLREMGTAPSS